MKKVLFAIIFLGLLGCEKEVNLLYDTGDTAKIVVGGYISPQGSELFIRKLIPMGDTINWENYFLNDALAVLYQDSMVLDTFRNMDSLGRFSLAQNSHIITGQEYLLKVKSEGLAPVEVHLQIPAQMGALSGIYESVSAELGRLSYSFDKPSEALLLVTVAGYDSLGIERQIYSEYSADGDCSVSLTESKYVYPAKCLNISNPRISFEFEKQARDWSQQFVYVNLHKIVYTITMIDGQYAPMLEVNLGDQLGYFEPAITESNVIGGYGVVLPKNTSSVVISF